jgi:molecular chaperone GrpE
VTHDPTDPRPGAAEPPPLDDGEARTASSTEEAVEGSSANDADELARLEGERDAYLDALQRLKAEFDNFRKRNDRDRQMVSAGATREVVRDLLPVMDNLERAVAALGDQGESIVAGLEMVRGQLAALLTGHGVEEIPASGEAFDPTVHEAIASVPSPQHDEGAIIEVVEKGYRHSEHVLRPTRVVIAAARPPAASPATE